MADFHAWIRVPTVGYVWDADQGVNAKLRHSFSTRPLGRVLRAQKPRDPRSPPAEEAVWQSYDPFDDEPALFRVLADLEPYPWPDRELTPEEVERFRNQILQFANEYGDFDGLHPIITALPKQARLMRAAIELWDAVCAKNRAVLDRYVHFFRPGEYDHEAKFGECAYLTYLRQEFGGLRKFRGWGLRCTPIAEAIVEMPRSWHCSPRLEKDCELVRCAADLFALLIQSQVGAEVVVRVERDCGTPLMSFLVKVDTLLQSLWIQLAYSLVEGSEYKRCKVCSKPFAVGKLPNGRTVPRDKESCSENCRVKLCQSKQRKARKMQAEGKKPQEIAKAVNSKIETVKRWLGKK